MIVSARGEYRPTLTITKIPRCPQCGASNPRALIICPSCAHPAPPTTTRVAEATIAGLPGLLIRIGNFLRKIAG